MSLKIVSLLLLLILFRYFYIAIAVWVLSIVPNVFKRNLIYKYVYSVDRDRLIVKRVINEEKSDVLEDLLIDRDIKSVRLGEAEKKYYDKPVDYSITIEKKDGKTFSITGDDYFFAVIEYILRQEKTL
ncbi:MAG: hypothetical protein IJ735_04715 [Clostridia bacterium]|nr:hypothetical protein [Clostridia bacterium]